MKHLFISFLSLFTLLNVSAQQPETNPYNNLDINKVIRLMLAKDAKLNPSINQMIYDTMLVEWESKYNAMICENLFNEITIIDTLSLPVSQISDSVYEERLKNITSSIPLAYNHIVKRYIVAYTTTKRRTMEIVMGRSIYFFPIIEAELDAAQMPQELRMLAVVESALSPTARSHMGASGLWQFMYGTAKMYDLEINSFIDQRLDPVVSTRTACRYLKWLYSLYDDWALAMAAYNCGPGNVNKAIRRANGSKNFWELYPYLPKETRGYVPSFVAASYAYAYHKQHNIVPDEAPLPLITDTIMVNRIMHFEQISSTINTPIEVLRALNPQYKMDIIPAVNGKVYTLVLPHTETGKFIDNEARILEKDIVYMSEYLRPSKVGKLPEFIINSRVHRVRSGETLSHIAEKYNVKVRQIMKWNNIKNASRISVGQRLTIHL